MKKDINFHIAEHVQVVAVQEWDEDFLAKSWNVYLVNNASEIIETVLVVTRGQSDDRKTATLRYNLGNMEAQSAKKVEFILEEVLSFINEYMVTYFSEDKLHEKRFVFEAHQISEKNTETVTVLDKEGVVAK